MRSIDQPSGGSLGKKVEAPAKGPEIDQWEPYKSIHGPMLRNKRTGQLKTLVQPKGPQFPPWSPAIEFFMREMRKGPSAPSSLPFGGRLPSETARVSPPLVPGSENDAQDCSTPVDSLGITYIDLEGDPEKAAAFFLALQEQEEEWPMTFWGSF